MAYCTQADILKQISEEELIDLTDDTHAGSVNADVVTEAIEKADAMIPRGAWRWTAIPGCLPGQRWRGFR